MEISCYDRKCKEMEESGSYEKFKRKSEIVGFLEEQNFKDIKKRNIEDSPLEDSGWMTLGSFESLSDYIFGRTTMEESSGNIKSDIEFKLKKLTDKHGEIVKYGDFIIQEIEKEKCYLYAKLSKLKSRTGIIYMTVWNTETYKDYQGHNIVELGDNIKSEHTRKAADWIMETLGEGDHRCIIKVDIDGKDVSFELVDSKTLGD